MKPNSGNKYTIIIYNYIVVLPDVELYTKFDKPKYSIID